MAASIPFIDDDDEFDWDAAVREIDDACQSTATLPFQTPPQPQPQPPPVFGDGQNRNLKQPQKKNSRQSTLDNFVSNRTSNLQSSENQDEQPEDNGSGCYVDIDPEAAKTWVYPDNVPRREYQLAISKTALFSNTLVALPTGLGKTLIAAVVMYNYFRWFPEGKIVFAAPSRPLVMQQIEACHNIVGIPQEWTIDMTGLTSPPKRAALWKSKRVFFVTPQVLEKDIQSGSCLVKYLVCLVIDEAHRAMGNYSYCVAVRELMAAPVGLRILALTATPGSKQQTIQQVIDNLQISTLEYRSESDHDVCPYVHNRKIELTEVPMGKPATDIHNLFLEVIRPIASKLSSFGLLQPRDVQTLSPCDLLNSRDKFRQAPPPELSHLKYSEVEGYFGVLITLYHIRKLLTSHGIRPASEMLEEKLRQGYFARYMSRNETIQKAKHQMEQNLSHGAPSPKLTKMMEVLVDHFKTNDPQKSRVIIFSNFRGSVRDILDTLGKIGNAVKATQFIGQNSGKSLKGQTQKIQQAVLEKFRTGGYNVIVATSIGEEGLDIMEVDLVICFDANVSPLRMIQRMGRTGRKHDGRVVVLACEGSELKGYMRKQATAKTVKKHMQNGGMNSFNFHSSPRMVPHSLKPEVQFQELSIEKFVRQTKKAKTEIVDEPKFCGELTEDEASLLGKYFLPDEKPCRPSLIAFPHFQAFPSRVHRVMHSSRTGWLIDVMQLLQGLPLTRTSSSSDADCSWSHGLATENIEQYPERGGDILEPVGCAGAYKEIITSEAHNSRTTIDQEKHMLDLPGRVLEKTVLGVFSAKDYTVPDSPIQNGCDANSAVRRSQLQCDAKTFEADVGDSIDVHLPPFDERYHSENIGNDPEEAKATGSIPVNDMHSSLDITEFDLSPRLTNLIESGFVPESPLSNSGSQNDEGKKEIIDPELNVPLISHRNNSTFYDEVVNVNEIPKTIDLNISPASYKVCTPSADGNPPESPSNQVFRTPLQNLTNSSCSKDWILSSGEKTRSVEHPFRLKRLRKIGDLGNERHNGAKEKGSCPSVNLALRLNRAIPDVSNRGRVKRRYEDARDFIDVEAEVSSDDVVQDSQDEGDPEDSDSYEGSFIDDRVEPTIGTTSQADSAVDMMAIYRRSLLTQSPFQRQQHDSTLVSPQSIPTTKGGESSGRSYTLDSPQSCSEYPNISAGKDSTHPRLSEEKVACHVIPSTSGRSLVSMDSRRRKMVSTRTFVVPAKNLEKEFSIQSGVTSKEPSSNKANANDPSFDAAFSDDKFYEGVDFDALEEEATKLLSQRKAPSVPGKQTSEHAPQNAVLFSAPSFDLGIL